MGNSHTILASTLFAKFLLSVVILSNPFFLQSFDFFPTISTKKTKIKNLPSRFSLLLALILVRSNHTVSFKKLVIPK